MGKTHQIFYSVECDVLYVRSGSYGDLEGGLLEVILSIVAKV